MSRRPLLPALLLLAACAEDGALLTASGITAMAPLPGQDRTVAYLTLENRGSVPVTLQRVSSRQFATVEMHATIVDDGIAGMQLLDGITIAEGSRVEFTAGGRHLMLIAPHEPLAVGDPVTLQFHYDQPGGQAGLLVLSVPLEARLPQGDD